MLRVCLISRQKCISSYTSPHCKIAVKVLIKIIRTFTCSMNLKYLVNWVNLASRMLLYTGNPHSWLWKAVWIILITFWCPRESGVFDPVYEDTVNHKLLLSWFLIFDANLMAVCYSVNKQGKNLRWFWYLFCRLKNKRLIICLCPSE